MNLFPLFNTLRIALLSTLLTGIIGVASAYGVTRLTRFKGVIDVVFTLPLVLPPTVIGFFILKALGPNTWLGQLSEQYFGWRFIMEWHSAILATMIVTFPLMYRTVRAAFESFDQQLIYAGQTLGKSNAWIFWRVILPNCQSSLLAGLILTFARGLGEYGATSMVSGYIPGQTATISTTVYQLWRTGQDGLAYQWVMINIAISATVLIVMNRLEQNQMRR